jgi:hypothetical protein
LVHNQLGFDLTEMPILEGSQAGRFFGSGKFGDFYAK